MKKKTLSKKEIKEINNDISKYGFSLDKKDKVEYVEEDGLRVILLDSLPLFFYLEKTILPTLKSILKGHVRLPAIVVDMGAVKFVANGADIMRPGIVEIDAEVEEGKFVSIVDKNNRQPLAVGKSLLGYDEMQDQKSGKSVLNMHYVGDKIWNFSA